MTNKEVMQPEQSAKTFVQERAQLEQEWCELQHLKAAYKLPQPASQLKIKLDN